MTEIDWHEKNMRADRDGRLRGSDWTQLPDAPCDAEAWAVYRQQLRDLPSDPNWPDVTFPDPPG